MPLSEKEFRFLADTIKGYSGINLDNDKEYLLESRLLPIASKYGLGNLKDLVAYMRENKNESFLIEIMEAMTTNESLFFRDIKPFQYLTNIIIPEIIKKHPDKKTLKIWSAACSTGQEPYSVIMALLEDEKCKALDFSIFATDLDFHVLERAKEGLYSQFEVQRGVPINLLLKYFTQEGDQWRIKDDMRKKVKFEKFNLLDNAGSFDHFDIIMCRNVLIYFDEDTKKQVLHSLCSRMEPHSVLFLGASESVIRMETGLVSIKDEASGKVMPGVFHFS